MRTKARHAYNALKAINAPVFTRSDIAYFGISGESGEDDAPIVDYYSPEYGEIGVDQEICDILSRYDLFCEWANPGWLEVYDN